MKKQLLLLLFGLSALNSHSQESEHSCSALKSKQKLRPKSGSLTPVQITKTEKYDVKFYELDVAMTNQNTSISGSGSIHGTTRVALDSILYELFSSFTISEIRLNGIPTPYSRVGSAIKVPVNLAAGQNFIIETDYSGTPPSAVTNPLGGSGMSNDVSPSWGNRVTWSLSEPFLAYEWWPCKQSLRDKADSVSIKITVPNACKAGSNGVLEQVVNLGNGTSRYEWKHRHPIDYYLISVAVAEYVEYNVYANPVGAPHPILIQNYIYNNPATLPNFKNDIDETADFLEYFSDIFGLYPFHDEKYGHCMAPLSGGMEHQTMTTQGFFTNTLTAHELAHQWFGDHVTCASWSDIWVNEGFASYAEYLMLAEMYSGQQVQDMNDRHNNIMSVAGGSVWVEDSLNDGAIFSSRLTYNKGAAIIHTMRFILNDDVQFFQALKNYQNEFHDSVAIGTDVQQVFEDISGINFTPFFEEWYFGEGFPTYSAKWNTVNGNLHLQVTHTTSMPSVTPTFTNPIEIKFGRTGLSDTTIRFDITANETNFIVPMTGNITSIKGIDPNNWIINKIGTIQKDINFTLGTESISMEEQISIYPNPTNGPFLIKAPQQGTYTVKVFDTKGKFITDKEFSESIEINLNNYPSGIYMLQIESSNGDLKARRLIRQ